VPPDGGYDTGDEFRQRGSDREDHQTNDHLG
jgi:hypothetical protein